MCLLKGLHTPSNLQSSGGDLKVLADIVAVKHGIDVGEVNFLVGELTTLLQDWTQGNINTFVYSVTQTSFCQKRTVLVSSACDPTRAHSGG